MIAVNLFKLPLLRREQVPSCASRFRSCSLILGLVFTAATSMAASLTVSNTAGNVSVVVTAENRLMVSGSTPDGAASVEYFSIIRNGEDLRVEVAPRDSTLDLKISLPLGYALEATTTTGDISIEGMVHLVHLETKTDAIRLTVPLQSIRMMLESAVPPPGVCQSQPKAISHVGASSRRGSPLETA
jgi:hypothetical protein